jgi:hypothetical protein
VTLEAIQLFVWTRLDGDTPLNGAVVIMDDGAYATNTDAIEAGLKSSGLVLLVGQPEPKGIESTINPGNTILRVGVSVSIYENQVVCRKAGGLNITAAEACQLVMERILGSSAEPNTRQRFFPIDNGFENFGKELGVNLWVASFGILVPVTPRP